MDISITKDMEEIRDFLIQPYIWERASEDNNDSNDFYPITDDHCNWLTFKEDENIIGIILLHTDTHVTLKMHIYLNEEHRKKAKEMMILFYEWFLVYTTAMKLNSAVPLCYPEVVKFAKSVGFKDEGTNRMSYMKNEKLFDQINFGITKEEIKGVLAWD